MNARAALMSRLRMIFGAGRPELFENESTLLLRRGHFLRANLRRHGVKEEDLLRAMHAEGRKFKNLEAALLKPDGTFSFHERPSRA